MALALSFRQPGPPDDRSDAASMGLPVPGRRATLRGTRRTGGPRGSGSSGRTGTRSSSGTRASPSSRLHPSPSAGPAVHEPFARRGGRGSPPASPGYGRNFRSRCVFIVFPVPQCPRAAADSAPAPPAQRGSRSGWQSPHPQTPVACAGWLAPVVLSARDRAGEWAGEMPR